ncbi:helicase HerA domain-containing protein [Mycobacteroides abscessus]|uniref:helicase HerA domain-containing protein n=1 Tax=Mycobacteroides abscessus TaxID=36809 RepID=UPI0009285060|nr:DUF87 domain-containing protein [Mycobacteroides abscessus]RIT40451.1 ATP-binding protein [Mycobacteroides abscessus]SIB99628.1 Type IV secretory pathway, VirB4 components [Mycobacteroides abscessus subsp. abscessus]SKT91511.1 Type IV secretory pathway, VirB4 components [Mycobacteroides abscessus subsp. massiliense]SKU10415.1 Type IV secretory pathway, VirB4 components [Mycobacteroides abscessus subsp. massiliense]
MNNYEPDPETSAPQVPRTAAPVSSPSIDAAGRIVGIVGSPSSTGELTMDIVDSACGRTLLGDLVYTTHELEGGSHLLALGAVGEIETRNRWHEDPNMRGVLRIHGSLPHLSADGDVRTGTIQVQAVYRTDAPKPPFSIPAKEAGGSLGMSPTTGVPVFEVDDTLVQSLIAHHRHDVVYLGHVYRSHVRLPLYVKDFQASGDGAYHMGVFGRNGSGKTAFACYWLAMQMRHKALSILIFDPQGQFTSQEKLPFDLHRVAEKWKRPVMKLSIAEDIQLPKDAPLAFDLLDRTGFFKQLTLKERKINREVAVDELTRILRGIGTWHEMRAEDTLRALIGGLAGDNAALQRIYATDAPRDRLAGVLATILSDNGAFRALLDEFAPVHSLFTKTSSKNNRAKTSLRQILTQVLDRSDQPKPLVIIDLSARSGTSWLDEDDTKARLIRKIAADLHRAADETWRERGSDELINCAVVFDEAARFATGENVSDEVERLANRLVTFVRETRKTGLGWMFITQEITSLHRGIYAQLAIKAFGYGLSTGSNLARLQDEVGHTTGLDLYQSFPDPRALREKVYPFMLTGPVSPLSFTAAPVFLQVFNNIDELREANRSNNTRSD